MPRPYMHRVRATNATLCKRAPSHLLDNDCVNSVRALAVRTLVLLDRPVVVNDVPLTVGSRRHLSQRRVPSITEFLQAHRWCERARRADAAIGTHARLSRAVGGLGSALPSPPPSVVPSGRFSFFPRLYGLSRSRCATSKCDHRTGGRCCARCLRLRRRLRLDGRLV